MLIRATRRSTVFSLCLLVLTILVFASPGRAQSLTVQRTLEGKARVVDGDTLEIGVHRFDLHGIDAPEADQQCERDGRQWRCGSEATYAMAALIETHWLTCRPRDLKGAVAMVADCRIGGPKGINVNREIVRQGWALAIPQSGEDYAAAEREAKFARAGLWSGTFVAPWQWRRTQEPGKAEK